MIQEDSIVSTDAVQFPFEDSEGVIAQNGRNVNIPLQTNIF